jgi:hypothetical protein
MFGNWMVVEITILTVDRCSPWYEISFVTNVTFGVVEVYSWLSYSFFIYL